MNKKDILREINLIETKFDVQSLTYKNIQIWPAVRAYIQLRPTIEAKNKKKKLSDYVRDPLYFICSVFYCFIIDARKNHYHLKNSEYLFIFDSSAKIKKDNVWINKFAEPLFNFIPKEKSHFFIEYSLSQKMWVRRHSKSFLLNPLYLLFLAKRLFQKNRKIQKIENFQGLTKFLQQENISLPLKENILIGRMEKIIRFKDLFSKVLTKVNPKVVFTSVYYANISLGLTLAANEKGIKTVEIQHGQQGNYHPAYSNWENYPNTKYAMHPDIFWMWSESNAERIKSWSKGTIKVLNGGNPWLNYYFNNVTPSQTKVEKIDLSPYSNKILVSLQFTDDFIDSFIPNLMVNNSTNTFWLLRIHPGQLAYKSILEKTLKNKGCSNYDIEYSTAAPLYEVFSLVDYNITFWSTVAYEAQVFGVKNIIIHPNGKASMKHYIDSGIFAYADNKDDFLATIKNFQFKEPSSNYMEYEDKFLEEAMREINTQIN